MTTTATVRNIPLDRLVLSPANVRKSPASASEDAELKASIRAGGLKQNLIVCPYQGEPERFAVTAGGRQLKALQELAAEGAIASDCEVPCLVEQPDAAIETSLMENTVRAAMHPADEFTAMAGLIDSGATAETVAARFGVSERHVRQRLKLGKLAPELLDAFRAGKLSLELITAFTLGADHSAQLAVWGQIRDQHYVSPHQVRRLLTGGAVPLDSDLGLFVGSEAYEAAGGRVTRDLFSGDDDGFLDDMALVNRLAIEKLEKKAVELRADWAWVKAVLDPDYGFMAQYRRIEPLPAEYPPEIAAVWPMRSPTGSASTESAARAISKRWASVARRSPKPGHSLPPLPPSKVPGDEARDLPPFRPHRGDPDGTDLPETSAALGKSGAAGRVGAAVFA